MTEFNKIIENLTKKNKELEYIINKSPVIVLLWKNEENWPVEFVSENISQFGFTQEEFISGKIKYSEIIYAEDLKRVQKEVDFYINSDFTEFTQEYRIIDKSNEIRWIDDRTFIRRDTKDEITHFQGVIFDITEKKKILEELKNSEQKFRMISEQALVAIGIIQDDKIVYVNQKAAEIFGYEINEMKSWAPGEFAKTIHPDHLEEEIKYINQIQTDSTVNEIQFQTKGISKSGEEFWAEALFKKFLYNDRPALIGMFINITERKRVENALKFTQFAVDHSVNPALWMDDQFNIIYVNEAMCKSLGYTEEELLGMKGLDLNPTYPKDAWEPTWKEIKEKGSLVIETYHKKKNGVLFPVEVYLSYLQYDNKEYNCAFVHDISERKESLKIIKDSEEKYREAFYRENFYKDLFTHDMKNIMQAINSSLEIYEYILRDEMRYAQDKKLLDNIHSQIDRGAHLINNIKRYSDLESFELPLIKLNIYKIIQSEISIIQNLIKNQKIFIELLPREDPEFFSLGNELIHEIFENILQNSIIHNENEKIIISILIFKILKEQKSYIRIEISDNGRGIEDSRKNIVFNRAYNQDKSKIGMGLGLSLVKLIIEKFDGEIWIEDKVPGDYKQGSRFIILLPQIS
ncbi:MAG: PAS domain S-box protein [Promethearchaeota archaeon]